MNKTRGYRGNVANPSQMAGVSRNAFYPSWYSSLFEPSTLTADFPLSLPSSND